MLGLLPLAATLLEAPVFVLLVSSEVIFEGRFTEAEPGIWPTKFFYVYAIGYMLEVASDEILVFANFSRMKACKSIFLFCFTPPPNAPLLPYSYFETLECTSERS